MKRHFFIFLTVLSLLGCSATEIPADEGLSSEKAIDVIMAAKTPYALAKADAPLLNTPDWENIFGGNSGSELQYDRFGEIDQLVLIAPKGTLLTLQRQIRKKLKTGTETIYYKVGTDLYSGSESLWVDGRFLDLQEVRPLVAAPALTDQQEGDGQENLAAISATAMISRLRGFVDLPYTWHGASEAGIPDLLLFYPPSKPISERMKNDWILKGLDNSGLLSRASNGKTPLEFSRLTILGESVFPDLSQVSNTDNKGNRRDPFIEKAKKLQEALKPLDLIFYEDRLIIVLDNAEVIESRYRSAFDGKVTVSTLFDTLVGLYQKAEFIADPSAEVTNPQVKRFFIRRFL